MHLWCLLISTNEKIHEFSLRLPYVLYNFRRLTISQLQLSVEQLNSELAPKSRTFLTAVHFAEYYSELTIPVQLFNCSIVQLSAITNWLSVAVSWTVERLNKSQTSSDEIKFGHPMTVILFGVNSPFIWLIAPTNESSVVCIPWFLFWKNTDRCDIPLCQ